MTSEGDALVSVDTMKGLGYFIAGGTAGAISRTSTAPFDRLKTYLIANTGSSRSSAETVARVARGALEAAGDGQLGKAIKRAGSPLTEAIKTIYRFGGVRSFFVGIHTTGKMLILGNGLNVLKVFPESAIRFGLVLSR